MRSNWMIQITDGEIRVANVPDRARRLACLTGCVQRDESAVHFAQASIKQDDMTNPATDLSEQIVQTVRRATSQTIDATLIIPSSWCYIQRFDLPQRRPNRTALEFALEEFLPVEIENVTCEFLRCGANAWIGVAIETARLKPVLSQLQVDGIHVERITLDVLEAASLLEASRVIWVDQLHYAELALTDVGPSVLGVTRSNTGLTEFAAQPPSTDESVGGIETVICGALPECVAGRFPDYLDQESRLPRIRPNPIRTLEEFSLARGGLAPAHRNSRRLQALKAGAIAASLALLVVAGAQVLHRAQLNIRLGQINDWEQSLYQQVFPDQPVPAGVALRLSSERRRLEGLTQITGGSVASTANAIDCLRELVAALPNDLRLSIQELRIDGNDVTLRGVSRDPSQAERLTQALSGSGKLQAESPRTDRTREGGVQFFAHARRISETTKQAKK